MNTRQVLFTGTFDPFHIAHLWQLERAYADTPFAEVVIAVIEQNPKKPRATTWPHRVEIAKLTIASRTLPFSYLVLPIANIMPATIAAFCAAHMHAASKPLRIIGSDSLIEFAEDPQLRPVLADFEYLIMMRPETKQCDAETALASVRADNSLAFEGKLILIPPSLSHIQDVSARRLRPNTADSSEAGLIAPKALHYLQKHKLYEYEIIQS